MDNLYEYLIALVFIVSILSEFFKKKKKKETSAPSDYENTRDDTPVEIERTFEDIFGVKPPITKKETQTFNTNQSDNQYNNSNVKYQYDSASYAKPELIIHKDKLSKKHMTSLEHDKQNKTYMPNQNTGYTKQEMQDFTETIDHLKNSLFNYNSLRDYIVATEVLNKPISLRRRCQRN